MVYALARADQISARWKQGKDGDDASCTTLTNEKCLTLKHSAPGSLLYGYMMAAVVRDWREREQRPFADSVSIMKLSIITSFNAKLPADVDPVREVSLNAVSLSYRYNTIWPNEF